MFTSNRVVVYRSIHQWSMPFRYLYNPYHQGRTTTPQLLPQLEAPPQKKTPHIHRIQPPPQKNFDPNNSRRGASRWPSAFAISDGHANLCGLPRLAISPRALRDTSTGRALVGLEGDQLAGGRIRESLHFYPLIIRFFLNYRTLPTYGFDILLFCLVFCTFQVVIVGFLNHQQVWQCH